MKLRPSCDYCVTVMWQSCDYCVTVTWPSCDYCVTVTWPSCDYCDCHMTIVWLLWGCHVTWLQDSIHVTFAHHISKDSALLLAINVCEYVVWVSGVVQVSGTVTVFATLAFSGVYSYQCDTTDRKHHTHNLQKWSHKQCQIIIEEREPHVAMWLQSKYARNGLVLRPLPDFISQPWQKITMNQNIE